MNAVSVILLVLSGCAIDQGLTRNGEAAPGAGDSGDALDPPDDPDARVRTAGTELWLGFMENLTLDFNGPPAFAVVVEAPEGGEGAIEVPATGFAIPFSLEPGEIAELPLPDASWYSTGSDVAGVAGVRVTADRPVEAVGVHYRLYFSEAARLLPQAELGADYRVLAVPDRVGGAPSSFVVVATRDDTEVEVTPSALTLGLRPADMPYTVTLAAGETWQVQAAGDLSGSRVRALSGGPVAVFAGARQAYAGCGQSADSHVWDTVPPLDRWGRHTIAQQTAGKAADQLRILAHEDGTEVRVDCGEPFVLDAGEVEVVSRTGETSITSSAPVLVGQVLASGECDRAGGRAVGDPNLTILPPAPLTRVGARFRSVRGVDTLATAVHAVSLRVDGDGALTVDGAPVDAESVQVGAGDHVIQGDAAFQGVAYGLAEYDAYTYHLGYDCTGCLRDLDTAPACD